MYLLPSFFTAGSLGAGYFSVTQTIASLDGSGQAHGHLDWAAIAILFAIPFDALDGRIARLTNTASDFGRELDSLADVITFGMAPSILAFVWGFHFLPDSMNPQLRQHLMQAGAFICFLFLLGGASRLARFNISPDAQPRNPGRADRKYFVGMPIPAAAGLLAATVHFFNAYPVEEWWVAVPWLILVGLTGFLMVSTWRFWSAKEINFSRRHPFQLIVLLALLNDTVPVRVLEPTSDNEPELFITIGVEILKLLPVIKIPLPELTVTPVELPKPVLLLTAKVQGVDQRRFA